MTAGAEAGRSAVTEAPVTLGEAARLWARIGVLSFGGAAAQIAMLHRLVVEQGHAVADHFVDVFEVAEKRHERVLRVRDVHGLLTGDHAAVAGAGPEEQVGVGDAMRESGVHDRCRNEMKRG